MIDHNFVDLSLVAANGNMRRQKGVATLFTAIVLLALVTLVTILSARVLVFEQAASGNQMRATQAFEAAQYGLERGVAWLQARAAEPAIDNWSISNPTPCKENNSLSAGGVYSIYSIGWSPLQDRRRFIAPSALCNAGIPNSLVVTMGSLAYDVDIEFIQNISQLSDLAFVRVIATATAQDTEKGAAATVEQIVSVPGGPAGTGGNSDAPIVVRNCVTNVTGTPDLCPANVQPANATINQAWAGNCATGAGDTGVALRSIAGPPSGLASDEANCLPVGSANKHINIHGGTREFEYSSLSVWQSLFGENLSPTMVRDLADAGVNGFMYYDGTLNNLPAQGTPEQPVLIYVAAKASNGGCPKLSPGTYHGLIYYEDGTACDLHGGGRALVNGTIAVEGSLTKFNANTVVKHAAFTSEWQRDVAEGASVFARVPGSWRDFQ